MSRERDAIELIWKEIEKAKRGYDAAGYPRSWPYTSGGRIEQILTQMEDLIQEDLEQMERSSSRSRETPRVCPLLEEYKKSQEATNTQVFWSGVNIPVISFTSLKPGDTPAEGDTYSPI